MRHLVFACLVLSFAVACAPAGEEAAPPETAAPAASMEADMQAIVEIRGQEVAAFTAGGDLSYLAEDAVLMPPNQPAVVGMAAMLPWAQEFAAQVTVTKLDYTDTEVIIAGDYAIERYAASVEMTPAGSDETIAETIKGIHIYQRQADGSWRMVQDVWNSDQGPSED